MIKIIFIDYATNIYRNNKPFTLLFKKLYSNRRKERIKKFIKSEMIIEDDC